MEVSFYKFRGYTPILILLMDDTGLIVTVNNVDYIRQIIRCDLIYILRKMPYFND